MKRRQFVASAAGAPVISSAALQGQQSSPKILELRWYRMRNTTDNQRGRLAEVLSIDFLAACQRKKIGPVGLFSTSVGSDAPSYLAVIQHESLAAFGENWDNLTKDEALSEALKKHLAGPLLYQRMEVQLLKGWPSFPGIEVPPTEANRPPRIFEMRIYESNNSLSLAKKVGMFEGGEIDIFRKSGLLPVFFGSTIAGPRMPNLTYMIAFDNLAARETNWRTFGQSPEWRKLSATPGLSDGETVSNITNILLSPMRGSQIR